MAVPQDALAEVTRALALSDALAAAGRRIAFGACPLSSRVTATSLGPEDERPLPLGVVADPAALAEALDLPAPG